MKSALQMPPSAPALCSTLASSCNCSDHRDDARQNIQAFIRGDKALRVNLKEFVEVDGTAALDRRILEFVQLSLQILRLSDNTAEYVGI
jgi:hypothetical protein